MRHKLFRTAAVATLALLVTSCASAVAGTPQAAPDAVAAETSTKSTAKSTAKSGTATKKGTTSTPNTSIANATGPCKFISPEMAQKLSLKSPGIEEKDSTLPAACLWGYGTSGGLYVGLIGIGFGSLESTNNPTLIDAKIGDRRAKQVKAPNGQKNACSIVLEHTENEMINITGVLDASSTDTEAACKWVIEVATLIESDLK